MIDNILSHEEINIEAVCEFKRSAWWKIYFAILMAITFLGSVGMVISDAFSVAEYINIVLTLLASIGLFGFVFLKRIICPGFWWILLITDIVYGILYLFIANIDLQASMSDIEYYISTAISILASIPAYYAIYKYSKKDNLIWSKV